MELPPAGRRGSFLLVALLLLISVLLEQYWLVRLFPWLGDLGGVQPMIVFLDIPLRLPVIDWIPVGILFLFFYLVAVSPELSRQRQYWQQHPTLHSSPSPVTSLGQKGWAVFTGWWLMLICLASGGGLYYLVEDQLPKQIRNGIESFGIRADLSIPWPGESIIHLHGGMIMLITFLIGARFFLRRTRLPQPVFIPAPNSSSATAQTAHKVPQPSPAEAVTMPSRIVMRPARPKPQPILATSQSSQTKSRSSRTVTQLPRTVTQPPRTVTQPPRTVKQPALQPYTQLPPEPTPAAMVRPCIVSGVLEPS
ncbi:MAG TPA: hypothetical protein VK518_20915 [Puia sp.]|nr:hypothetical protein [Puia sp.]